MVSGDGKKKETVCEHRLFLVIVVYSQTFYFAKEVAFRLVIEINFIALAYSQIFRFAQDVFNKIFSTLGNINKFLFLSLIEKIAHARHSLSKLGYALAYSQIVSLKISATVGCGNTTFLSCSMVMPASMATHAVEMSSEAGLPMRWAPMTWFSASVMILQIPLPPSFSATKRPE